MKILQPSDYRVVPWRNGRGTTTELFIDPPETSIGALDFDWRVSTAPVRESGPFSLFPGFDRLIAVVEGKGMHLRSGGRIVDLALFDVFRFPGDVATRSHIFGELRDLNVIYRRSAIEADLEIAQLARGEKRSFEGATLFLYVIRGSVRSGIETIAAAASCQAAGRLDVESSEDSVVAVVLIRRKQETRSSRNDRCVPLPAPVTSGRA